MPHIKVTVRDGRVERKGGQAGVTPQGWGEVLAEFEKDFPPLDEGDRLVLPDGAVVMVIGSNEGYGPGGVTQTVHVGRALDRYISAARSSRIGALPDNFPGLADAFHDCGFKARKEVVRSIIRTMGPAMGAWKLQLEVHEGIAEWCLMAVVRGAWKFPVSGAHRVVTPAGSWLLFLVVKHR
jgi:hypothetical protein